MEKKHLLHILLLIVGSLFMVISCTQEASRETETSAFSEDYKLYSHDGLSLQHPSHWTLAYDETPGLYSNRDIAFNTSEASIVNIFIYEDSDKSNTDIGNSYVRSLKLDTSKFVKDYQQSPLKIGNYKGIKLNWRDTMIVPYSVEIDILQVIESPASIFAVFELKDEDIKKEFANITHVLNSMTYQQISKD